MRTQRPAYGQHNSRNRCGDTVCCMASAIRGCIACEYIERVARIYPGVSNDSTRRTGDRRGKGPFITCRFSRRCDTEKDLLRIAVPCCLVDATKRGPACGGVNYH